MSVLMLVIDGAGGADYNNLPHLQQAQYGGLYNHTPKGRKADSLSCILHMLGVNAKQIPHGRAYLEALAMDIPVGGEDVIFRCNGVEIEEGRLKNACFARTLSTKDTEPGEEISLFAMGSYKNLLLVKQARAYFDSIKTLPPHEYMGAEIVQILPRAGHAPLKQQLQALVLERGLFPWGQAVKTKLPSFFSLHGLHGAVVCQTEIVKGIAKALGMFCPKLLHATADTDTDLREKAETALALLQEYDFVLLHINGADESAHRKNGEEKAAFLRRIDAEVLGLIAEKLPPSAACIVTSDHKTDAVTGKHMHCAVEHYILSGNEECKAWLK